MTTNEVLAIALKALKNGGGGGGGTSNYNSLENKPKINGVILQGNKTSAELHIDMSSLITADFDDTQNYAVGDIVIYQGNLYRFIQAHSAGAWDANDVESVTVVELIGEKATTVKISQAEYNALSSAEKHDLSKVYYIYDAPSGGGGTDDYLELENKPQINGVTLVGNKTLDDLGIGSTLDEYGLTNNQLDGLLNMI